MADFSSCIANCAAGMGLSTLLYSVSPPSCLIPATAPTCATGSYPFAGNNECYSILFHSLTISNVLLKNKVVTVIVMHARAYQPRIVLLVASPRIFLNFPITAVVQPAPQSSIQILPLKHVRTV